MHLLGRDNGGAGAEGQPPPAPFPKGFVASLCRFLLDLARQMNRTNQALENQLFKRALIRLSNSSNRVSPLISSPLMKKDGVEFTFNTSAAYF